MYSMYYLGIKGPNPLIFGRKERYAIDVATKKDPYMLPFINEVINIDFTNTKKSTQNHLCDQLGGFCVFAHDAIWCQKWTAHLSKGNN